MASGEVVFRSLLYFLSCEGSREDALERTHVLAPPGGLPVNNQTKGGSHPMPGWSFDAAVKNPDKVFIYATSTVFSAQLAAKFVR
jgi:hypothetical protein